MSQEKTPEEKARSKRAHADSMIVIGAVTTVCALAAAGIILSGRGDVPDWMFGGRRAARAATGDWAVRKSGVRFQEWGPAPFALAKKEGRLVLLFLGPSFSAPTARAESEVFADPAAAALVSERFVPVRVKSEEFPDLDRRYRAAGWPTIAALLPDGVVVDAGAPMSPEVFRRWAGALADKAAAHPEILSRADDEAAARRKEALAERSRGTTPPTAEQALHRARAALEDAWDPSRRTFDRTGPRFPRFERVAALRALGAPWADALTAEAAKGSLIFLDPNAGGFFRAANPDGTPAALEKIAADQAGALDALCEADPAAAKRELAFVEKSFAEPAGWRGWQAGYAVSPDGTAASDGANLGRWRRPSGPARLGEDADLSRAVFLCPQASAALKDRARRAIARDAAAFEAGVRKKDPRLLLDDAVAVGAALLAAGDIKEATSVWKWMETSLADGPVYLDRLATGVLPPELDRMADPALEARALRFCRALAAALPAGADKNNVSKRAEGLFFWLSARPDALDPAVWARLVVEEPR